MVPLLREACSPVGRRILRDVSICVLLSAALVTLVLLVAPQEQRTWENWKTGFGLSATVAFLSWLAVLWADEHQKDRFAPMMIVAARKLGLTFERSPMKSGLWMTGRLGSHDVRVQLFQRGTNRLGPHVFVTVDPRRPTTKEIDSSAVPTSAHDIVEMVESAMVQFEASSNASDPH